MATRVVEGKKPYTGGKAISIDENKVISLNLRDENNLIIYDEGDDEIYVDLQLPDGIEPTDAFPVGVTTGRAVVADGWDKAGTIISAKTTSGDEIKILYADDGTLWIDNGTGTFKQIYFKADVDAIVQAIWDYIYANCNTKTFELYGTTDLVHAQEVVNWVKAGNSAIVRMDGDVYFLRDVLKQGSSQDAPIGRLVLIGYSMVEGGYSDSVSTLMTQRLEIRCPDEVATLVTTVNNFEWQFLKTNYDYPTPYTPTYPGSPATKAYVDSHSGDVLVSDQANNIFTPGMKIWGGTESDYQSLTPDSNTAYLLTAGGPTPGGWQPGVNTVAYYPLDSANTVNDLSGNNYNLTNNGNVTFGVNNGVDCATFGSGSPRGLVNTSANIISGQYTYLTWINMDMSSYAGGWARVLGGTSNFFILIGELPNNHNMGPQRPMTDGVTLTAGWHLVCFVGDVTTGNFTSYLDGVSVSSGIGLSGSRSGIVIGAKENDYSHSDDRFKGNMSAIIWENKQRTAQEIADYFDQTKGDYGIS